MPGNLPLPPDSVTSQWPAPNYVDPVRRTWMPAYAITIHLVGTALVLIRFIQRARKEGGGFGLDDALLFPSWLLSTGLTALAIYSSKFGLIDRHIYDVPPSKIPAEALNAWIASFIFLLGTCCFKVSVLFFYRRIQANTYNPRWMIAIYVAIGFTIAYTLAMLLALIFNCNPTEAYWKAYDPTWTRDYHCTDTISVSILAGVLSVIGDAYSVILPCMMLQGLKVSRRQKIGLNIVFGVGTVVVLAGCIRTFEFHRLTREWDSTWVGFSVYFWSILEYELGIMCACAPSLRIFLKRYLYDRVNCRIGHKAFAGKDDRQQAKPATRLRTFEDPNFTNGFGQGSVTTRAYYEKDEKPLPLPRMSKPRSLEWKIPMGVWGTPQKPQPDVEQGGKVGKNKGLTVNEFLRSGQ